MGQPLMSGWHSREPAVSDSTVSQDYSAMTMPLSVLAMSPLCYSYFFRCDALLLKAFLPTLLTSSHPTPALLAQTGTQGSSRYLLLFGEILSLLEEE